MMISLDIRPAMDPFHVPMAWLKGEELRLKENAGEIITFERKRRVRFCLHANQVIEPEMQSISDAERDEIWYTSRDLTIFTKYHRNIANQARTLRKKGSDLDELCTRGLETYLSVRAEIDAKARKVSVKQAVLEEQRRQREEGINDVDKLRKKSRAASKKSRRLARELAELDEADVHHKKQGKMEPSLRMDDPRALFVRQDKFIASPRRTPLMRQASVRLHIDTESRMLILDNTNTAPSIQ